MPVVDPEQELLRLRAEVDAMWVGLCALGAMTGCDGNAIGAVLEQAAVNLPPESGAHLNALADRLRGGFDDAQRHIGERDVHG